MGLNSVNTWIQATDLSSLGTYYNLLLNPNGGNVAIGTTSTGFNAAGLPLVIGSGSGNTGLTIFSGAASSGSIHFADAETTGSASFSGFINYDHAANSMQFGTSNTNQMRITSGGNVGIGNTGASDIRLYITGQSTTSSNFALVAYNSSNQELLLVRNDGAFYTGTAANSPYNLTTGSGANVFVESGGLLYRSTSSLKYKKEVRDYDKGLKELMSMRPVYYKGKSENDGDKQFAGLIAEEIHELGLTEFVQYAEDGSPDALAYSNMVSLLVKAIQELTQKVNALENK
jgi:hypothetical protein